MATTMKVLRIKGNGQAAVTTAPLPKLRPQYILVKTVALALNPTDWKSTQGVNDPVTIGCDYAGYVEEVGSEVTKALKKGDRVCGFIMAANSADFETGADGEYCVAKGDLQIKMPDHMSFEEAATTGVGLVTVGQGLYQTLKLPWPDKPAEKEFPILIYGGSSATGALAVQLAKLSGLHVITTCSPRNFDYVKSLGADVVYDYSKSDCGQQIRNYTDNKLFYAYDTIGEHGSPEICAEALSSEKQPDGSNPQYCVITHGQMPRKDVDSAFTYGSTSIGEAFEKRGTKFPAKPQDFEHAKKFSDQVERLFAEKRLRTHRHELRPGGLEGVLKGLEDVKQGKVSGVKLVYRVRDDESKV